MKQKKSNSERNQAELYYKILKECVENPISSKSVVALKLGISESDSTFYTLNKLDFIEYDVVAGGIIELLPQGFNAYMSISAQKQSALQAKKAIIFATCALIISIASFIASIIFNIIAINK